MVTLDQAGAGASSLRLVPPQPELRSRVQHLWVETPGELGSQALASWRVVADQCAHLLYLRVRGRDGVAHRLLLVGPRSVAADIDKRDRLATAGVRLQPWALPALFGVNAVDLSDRGVVLGDIVGERASLLVGRLAAASTQDLPSALEAWLTPLAVRAESRAERRARSAARLLQAAATDCHSTASELGISARRLRSLMYEQIGLAPKVFARIVRLHAALGRARADGSWARIAAASGFSDQAHLIREFRHLLGETPGMWATRSAFSRAIREGARRRGVYVERPETRIDAR